MDEPLTFDAVAARFKRLDMTLVSRPVDTRGIRWKYGSTRDGDVGLHFYTDLERASQHAGEIAWLRGLENETEFRP